MTIGHPILHGRVMELEDWTDSKSVGRNAVWVRAPPRLQSGDVAKLAERCGLKSRWFIREGSNPFIPTQFLYNIGGGYLQVTGV